MEQASTLVFLGLPLSHYIAVIVVSFFASIIGGLAGYGTSLILPLILVPTIGPEPVVPVIGLSALFTNAGRLVAFRHDIDRGVTWRMALIAPPFAALGAYGYTFLSGRGVSLLLGVTLCGVIVLRHLLPRALPRLPRERLGLAAAGFGLLAGGTTGVGVLLVAMLTAAGLSSRAVIATDAAVSLSYGLWKSAVFGFSGILTGGLALLAILSGIATFPGGFVARKLITMLSLKTHALMLDITIVIGALNLLWRGISG